MKAPILFYTVHSTWRAEVFAVTSVNGGRLYGTQNDRRTSCYRNECKGKFATLAEAEAAIPEIVEINKRYGEQRAKLNEDLFNLNRAHEAELIAAYGRIEI